jgi:hypothetical protein
MLADVSLVEKGHQESFKLISSIGVFNPLFMKGNQLNRRVATCSKGGSQLVWGAGRDLLSIPKCSQVHNLLGEQVMMSHILFSVWTVLQQ